MPDTTPEPAGAIRSIESMADHIAREGARLKERWLLQELARRNLTVGSALHAGYTICTEMHRACYGSGIVTQSTGTTLTVGLCTCLTLQTVRQPTATPAADSRDTLAGQLFDRLNAKHADKAGRLFMDWNSHALEAPLHAMWSEAFGVLDTMREALEHYAYAYRTEAPAVSADQGTVARRALDTLQRIL